MILSCSADSVIIVCAFFAMSKRMRGMVSMSKEVSTVGRRDVINSCASS